MQQIYKMYKRDSEISDYSETQQIQRRTTECWSRRQCQNMLKLFEAFVPLQHSMGLFLVLESSTLESDRVNRNHVITQSTLFVFNEASLLVSCANFHKAQALPLEI